MLKDFDQLLAKVSTEVKKKIVVPVAQDADVLTALNKAFTAGLTDAVLVGSKSKLEEIAQENDIDLSNYEIIDLKDEMECVNTSVKLVREGHAQVLMKGLCSTANILRAILNKERGLRKAKVLSHMAVFHSPNYHKLLFMSDAAMSIAPDLTEKIAITQNCVDALHALGYNMPKAAILSAVEKVNPIAMPSTADAAIIAKMAQRGQIKDAIIDGPLALDNALSHKANEIKALASPVGGDADICIVPNIETGNVFYKLMTIIAKAQTAGVILGASVPVVLTSRADSDESKYLSIVTALAISQ